MKRHLTAAAAAAVLLAGCEARIGKDERQAEADASLGNQAAPAEEQFSLKIPGFEMKVDLPDEGVRTDEDSDLLFPGSRMTGVHIDAGSAGTSGEESVQLQFRSSAPPEEVEAWYSSAERAGEFTISSVARAGEGYRLTGIQKDGNDPFELWLVPSEGGTAGRLVFRERG